MDVKKIRLTFNFYEEQLETIKTFFNYNDWDFEESKESVTKTVSSGNCDVSTQTENTAPHMPCESQDDRQPIDQDSSEEECLLFLYVMYNFTEDQTALVGNKCSATSCQQLFGSESRKQEILDNDDAQRSMEWP